MTNYKRNTFYCFSPFVMLATFLIEILLIVYILKRYQINPLIKVTLATLLCLAGFQMAEFYICDSHTTYEQFWSRLGFILITFLPVFGLHAINLISGKKPGINLIVAYVIAAIWTAYFLMAQGVFSSISCTGNYVIFKMPISISALYGTYYFGLLALGAFRAGKFSVKMSSKKKKALLYFMIGYLLFLIPTAIANTINPTTLNAVPSIMCGFALLFALVYVFKVLPLTSRSNSNRKRQK